jgi:hypothetical protein
MKGENMKEKTETVASIRMDKKTRNSLAKKAKENYQTFAGLCRKVLEDWLKNNPLNCPPSS